MKIIQTTYELTEGDYKIICLVKEDGKVKLTRPNGDTDYQFTNTTKETLLAFSKLFKQAADVAHYENVPSVNIKELEHGTLHYTWHGDSDTNTVSESRCLKCGAKKAKFCNCKV